MVELDEETLRAWDVRRGVTCDYLNISRSFVTKSAITRRISSRKWGNHRELEAEQELTL
jgi:hypothetical protein